MDQIWITLNQLKQQQPKPYCDYAGEIGNAFCGRLIPKLALIWKSNNTNNTSTHQDVLLGLPRQDWIAFLEQHRAVLLENAKQKAMKRGSTNTSMSNIIAFLECPMLRI